MTEQVNSKFGKMILMYLASEGLTLTEAAKYIGTSKSTLSRICNGKECDYRTFIKLLNWMTRP